MVIALLTLKSRVQREWTYAAQGKMFANETVPQNPDPNLSSYNCSNGSEHRLRLKGRDRGMECFSEEFVLFV